jgi:flagellar operon protein
LNMPEIRFNPILSAGAILPVQTSGINSSTKQTQKPSESFSEVFNNALTDTDGVKFSKHAQTRLESRNIELDEGDLKKLGGAVDAASEKGVQDSLIFMNGLAFIVNVPDRTVVTAMSVNEASSNVFTNIDGAVIA